MFTAKTASGSSSICQALWRFSMMIEIIPGSAETEENAETVRPCPVAPDCHDRDAAGKMTQSLAEFL